MSRHTKMADDSCRMTIVVTKQMRQDLMSIAEKRLSKISDVVREILYKGIESGRKKWLQNKD